MLAKFKSIGGMLLIIVLVMSFQFPASAANDEPGIFLTTLEERPAYKSDRVSNEFAVTRVQSVNLDLAQLDFDDTAPRTDLSLQVFPEVAVNLSALSKKTNTSGTTLYQSQLTNDPYGYFLLAETDGEAYGELVYLDQKYQLRQKNGHYYFAEIDQRQFPEEAPPVIPEIEGSDLSGIAQLDTKAVDSGEIVDVMILYTEEAKNTLGSTANMLNLINIAIEETNYGYAQSGINHRVRLVHTEQVDYSENNFDWSSTLYDLHDTNDGTLDYVHTLRNQYGADLVSLFVSTHHDNYCGIGYLLPVNSSSYSSVGFSVVSQTCATGYYSFGHETGHNMGAHHDRDNASSAALFDYSYGFQDPDGTFRTVMAYNCPGGCLRVNRWSNADQTYNGKPIGVVYTAPNSADNRMTLNNSAYAVANFRTSTTLLAPSSLTQTNIDAFSVSMSYTDNSDNETSFKLERSLDGSNWSTIASLPANTTSYTDTGVDQNGLACNTDYYYKVSAVQNETVSDPSNTLSVRTSACAIPDLPTPINAVPALTSVSFSWGETLGETGFLLQQYDSGGSQWITLQTLPANSTSAVVSGLTKNTNYTFRLVVQNSYGDNPSSDINIKTHSVAVYLPLLTR